MFLHEIEAGSKVFIDANIFVYHFSKGSEFNKSCTEFLYRTETSQIHGFTSVAILKNVVDSQHNKTKYGFLSNDALTLKIMEDIGITNIASNDSDFKRVDWLKFYLPGSSE